MHRLLGNKKGQNTVEYAILITLVVGAVVAMQTYVKRGLQARAHDETVKMYQDVTGAEGWGGINPEQNPAKVTAGQYEPEGITSQSTQNVLQDEEGYQMFKGGQTQRETLTRTKQAEGDYHKYDYQTNKK